ncbi:MAG: AAA family ATPase [Proteobacteria bacterium]|nr:AAA family ATPase [Pseudomonadota bacterium]
MALNFPRNIKHYILASLARKKSVLMLGPRQAGKTTLLRQVEFDKSINLIVPSVRRQFEQDPDRLIREIAAFARGKKNPPLVAIDEIQLVPELINVAQYLIDESKAQFVLTGSSARRLKAQADVNLLPGRVVYMRLDPLNLLEHKPKLIEHELYFGSLPGIVTLKSDQDRDTDLVSYVETYLEEEIRKETKIRNLAAFSRFLSRAALDAGNIVNFSSQANESGVSSVTIQSYYQVLEDCMICERIEPFTESQTRKKLTRSPKFLFFDLGVRRIAAEEGHRLGRVREGQLFEQAIGLSIIRVLRSHMQRFELFFWNDPSGPEVDYIIKVKDKLYPIEIKYTENPSVQDIKHLKTFLREYKSAPKGFLISLAQESQEFGANIIGIHWSKLPEILFSII